MGREELYTWAGLRRVDEPTPDPETERHGFDQVSRIARADPRLSHRAFRILSCLEGYCFGDDRQSWASNRTIGKGCGGIGPNVVRLGLRELEQAGYIQIEPDRDKMRGQRISILYQLKQPDRLIGQPEED